MSHQPAYVGLLFYGSLCAILALIFGLTMRTIAYKSNLSTPWVSGLGILSGSLGLLTLMIIVIFG